jgi:hypothetical protein
MRFLLRRMMFYAPARCTYAQRLPEMSQRQAPCSEFVQVIENKEEFIFVFAF